MGGGYDARLVVDYLETILKTKEVFFVDKNETLHGKEIYKGIRCYGIEKVFGRDPLKTIILITTTFYANEILGELNGKPAYGTGLGVALSPYREKNKLGDISVNASFVNLLFAYKDKRQGLLSLIAHEKDLHSIIDLLDDDESLEIFRRRLPPSLFLIPNHKYLSEMATYPQYFPKQISDRFVDDEVFVDCGAYTGDTIEEFRKQVHDKFKAIYAFEMDDTIYKKCVANPKTQDERIMLIHAGVSNRNATIKYAKSDMPSYNALASSDVFAEEAELKSIDSLVQDGTIKDKITFVKMDIEGAELDALQGMKNLMLRDKPKLAICIYHKPEDLWEIPLYIHSLVPDYKFILRHHSPADGETVLYAYLG